MNSRAKEENGSSGRLQILGLIIAAGIAGVMLSMYMQLPAGIETEFYLRAKTVITTVNTVISMLLIFTYIRLYKDIRSNFTLALLLVVFAMLIYSLTSNPLFQIACGYPICSCGMASLGPFMVIPDIFAMLALGSLLYISTE